MIKTTIRIAFAFLLMTGLSMAQSPNYQVRPLTATIATTVTRTLPDGTVQTNIQTNKYWRDNLGRTRQTDGKIAYLSDPATNTIVKLDFTSKTAQFLVLDGIVQTSDVAQIPPDSTAFAKVIGQPTVVSLGIQYINGFQAKGSSSTITFPPGEIGNEEPITHISELWISDELGIPLVIKANSALIGERAVSYNDIVVDAVIDPALFEIPADFQVVDFYTGS